MKRALILAIVLLLLPAIAGARSVTVEWGYDTPATDLAGFVFYKDGVKVKEFSDPIARTFTGELDLSDAKACYTLTAIDVGGNETPHSACYYYDPAPDGSPNNLRVTVVDVQVAPPAGKVTP